MTRLRRISRQERQRRLRLAEQIAMDRATVFRTARRIKSGARKGELLTGHKLHAPTSTRSRNLLIEKGAKPVLKTSEWQAIYYEVGL